MSNQNETSNLNLETNTEEPTRRDILTLPIVNGVNLVATMKKAPLKDIEGVFKKIQDANQKLSNGDFSHLEDMLMNQAHVLESIFYSSTEKMLQSKHLNEARVYSEMALKAQKQCRNTITAIAELKNPKQTTFVKQQNNAINQQVNNSGNNLIPSNELLSKEEKHETLDARATPTPVAAYPQLAAMEKIERR